VTVCDLVNMAGR